MIYDLIVLGGGPGGYLAAERASEAGLSTLLIEKNKLGGVCLNEGCIPSKTLLHAAKIYDYARKSEKYGIISEKVTYDHKAVMQRKEKVINTLVSGIEMKLKKNKVAVVTGTGFIKERRPDSLAVAVNNEIYLGTRLLIATGSVPVIPPIPGLKENLETGFVATNKEILNLEQIPDQLVIIGGGVIGLEMASYYNSAGSKVTIIEMLEKIAGPIDNDIAVILLKNYKKKGIEFKLAAKVTEIKKNEVVFQQEEKLQSITCDKVLLSIGRRAVIKDIGLENIHVEIQNGAIKVDECGRTNIPNVYAAGDVNGKSMLAHTAYREAEVCINTMIGKKDRMRYHAIPNVIYTNPEVASAGETEETASAKSIDYQTISLKMTYSGRYLAENEGGDGICKILFDRKYNRLIGIHLIGNPASEIIFGASLMIETELKLEDLKELVFPHPTVSEIIRESLFNI